MFDSLPYRNDAAIVFRRLIRSLPRRAGVLGVATCDKGLPAMMMALAGLRRSAVRARARRRDAAAENRRRRRQGADASARVSRMASHAGRSRGARLPGLRHAGRRLPVSRHRGHGASRRRSARAGAAALGARALGADGLARHGAALGARAPSDGCSAGSTTRDILTEAACDNAMVVHAAFGGSTNLLLHIPAIAHAAGLQRPTVEDWIAVNRRVPRLVERAAQRSGRIIPPCASSSPAACRK